MNRMFVAAALLAASAGGLMVGFGPRAEIAAVAAASATALHDHEWAIDGAHSSVIFRVKHLNAAWFYGRFDKIDGKIAFNEADPSKSTLEARLDMNSIHSGNDKRDGHLKGEDFFLTSEFPAATFKSKSWSKTGDNTYNVTGDFTLRGVTKEITVPLEKTGASENPRFGKRVGFETTFTINRLDYGIKYMPEGLGTDVRITIAIEGMKGGQ